MIYFIGAGPGAEDLITVRGARLLEEADVIIYAGSLVNPALLKRAKPECEIYDSAGMTLEQVISVMNSSRDRCVVRLHTGDPCIYAEYTLPDVSQTVILTRMAGRTPVPEKEEISSLAQHGATMVVFLTSTMLEELSRRLIEGGYAPDSPAAIVYKATWPDQKVIRTTVENIPRAAEENGIHKMALILVGGFLGDRYERSRLYDPGFSHQFREAEK